MSIYDWSRTAADNDDADTSINWLEGQLPRTVNNSARTMMQRVAQLLFDLKGSLTTGGSSDDFTVVSNTVPTVQSDGFIAVLRFDRAPTGASTLTVDSLATKSLKDVNGGEITANSWSADDLHLVVFDVTNDEYRLMTLVPRDLSISSLSTSGTVKVAEAGSYGGNLNVKAPSTGSSDFAVVVRDSGGLTNLMFIRSDGFFSVGQGVNSPYNLTVGTAANVVVNSSGVLLRSTSSRRYKKNIRPYSADMEKFMKLKPISFESKSEFDSGSYVGFTAEDLDSIGLNEYVRYNEKQEPESVDYAYMVAMLTSVVQEQQKQIDKLIKKG